MHDLLVETVTQIIYKKFLEFQHYLSEDEMRMNKAFVFSDWA